MTKPTAPSTTTTDKVSKPTKEKNPSKYGDKYKYVRFVEKKKVLRKMRQLQRELLQGDSDLKEKIEEELAELRKDLMYVEKFPGNQKYISLFPSEGQLSEECLKKQAQIKSMIVNLTQRSLSGNSRRQIDAVKNDDFFASVDNVEKPAREPKPVEKPRSTPHPTEEPDRKKHVHPSWEAKKQNEKLTGSIAQTKFEGNRVVFDD
jgi:hypothetical protein